MKKLYLLAFMAATTLGLSAQTWNVAPQNPNHHKNSKSIQTKAPVVMSSQVKKSSNSSLLRSSGSTQLPDSIIYTDGDGVNISRNIYKYDENGWISSMQFNAWDAETSSWSEELSAYNTYKYDENGNEIYHTFDGWNGEKMDSQITNNIYDDQNRLLQRYIVGKDNHILSTYTYTGNQCVYYKTDSMFNERLIGYDFELYTLNEAGLHINDSIFSYEVNENNEISWYLSEVVEYTYDSQNREIASTTSFYDKSGYYGKIEKTTSYPGDGTEEYTIIQQVIYPDESLGDYRGDKCEIKEGNPTQYIYSLQTTKDGPWVTGTIESRYYPKGTVANETIKADMPALKAYAANGTLFINLNGTAPVQVYSVNGTCHYNATASGNIAIANLPAGIYIVKAGDETVKISVR